MSTIQIVVCFIAILAVYALGVATGFHLCLNDIDEISVKVISADEEMDDSYLVLPSQKGRDDEKEV